MQETRHPAQALDDHHWGVIIAPDTEPKPVSLTEFLGHEVKVLLVRS